LKTKIIFLWLCFNSILSFAQLKILNGGQKGCAPFIVTVTYGTSPSNWTFGNGNISSLDTASTTYSIPGLYWIVYNASDSIQIEVIDKPSCAFTPHNNSSTQGCLPFSFSLRDNSVYPLGVNPLSWVWLYGDLDSSSGNPTSHTILNHEPTAFVKMIVYTNIPSCNFDCEIPDYISCLHYPKAKIQRIDTNFCKPPAISLLKNMSTKTPLQIVNYLWEWKDPIAKSSTNFDINSISFLNQGQYSVKLTATNQLGCKSTDTFNVKVLPPLADFTYRDTFCASDINHFLTITDMDTSLYKYDVVFDPKLLLIRKVNEKIYEYKANTNIQGSYPIKLTVTRKSDSTCKSTIQKNVFVISFDNTIDLIDSLDCLPLNSTLKFKNSNAMIDSFIWKVSLSDYFKVNVRDTFSNDTTIQIQFSNYLDKDSFYRKSYLKISVSTELYNKRFKCESKSVVTKDLFPFAAYLISNKTSGCNPSTITYRVIPNIHHRLKKIFWFVDGVLVSNTDSFASFTFSTAGKHKVLCVAENSKGCLDTTNPIYVDIFDSISYNATMFSISPNNLCPSDTLKLINKNTNNQDYSFFRVQNKLKYCSNGDSVKFFQWDTTGKVFVYFFSYRGNCVSEYKDSILIQDNLSKINYLFECNNRDSLTFFPEKYKATNTYEWKFGDGTSVSNSSSHTGHKYANRGDYKITLKTTAANGLCPFFDTTVFSIRHVKSIFSIPNVLCKSFDDKYPLDPRLSQDAAYECQYTYTWFFEGPNVDKRPISIGDSGYFHIPLKNYTLGLIARDIHGCTDTAKQLIQTTSASADFDFDRNIYCRLYDTIRLSNKSTSSLPIKSYTWILKRIKNGFLINMDTSYLEAPVFIVSMSRNAKDSFYVSLEIKDSLNCSSSIISKKVPLFYDTLYQLVGLTPDSFCVGQIAKIYYNDSNLNKNNFYWYLNNGFRPTDSNRQIDIKFTNTGIQWFSLVVENKINKCRDTVRKSIITMPSMNIFYSNTADTAYPLCFGASSTLVLRDLNGTATTNLWYLNNDTTSYKITSPTFPLKPGENKIVGIIQNRFGCRDTIINYDTVIAPRANFQLDDNQICKGNTIAFMLTNQFDVDSILWDFGDGNVMKTKNIDTLYHTYYQSVPNNDSISVSLVLSAKGGLCPASVSKKIVVLESLPVIDTSIDSICKGDFLLKNISPKGDSFLWNFGNGKSSYLKNPTVNFDKSGTYFVQLIAYRNPLGCPDTNSFKLFVKPSPSLVASIDTVCLADSNILKAKDTSVYSKIWISPKINGLNWVDTIQKLKLDSTQKIKLNAINSYGCSDSLYITAGVIRPFKMDSLDTIVVQGKNVVLPIAINNGLYKYRWTPQPINFPCLDCSNPEITVMENKIYELEWRDTFGCFINKAIFDLKIYPDIGVKVPTAFTPNADGNNDIMYARGFGIKKLLHFKIYNRWGQLLFFTQDENIGWDGFYKGQLQPVDTYYYNVSAESFIPGKILSFEGNFLLLK
jgi:gliding motility-associated-like protein